MMKQEEIDERARVVGEAVSWLGTPYRHLQMVKGPRGGVDCAMLLRGVYSAVGIIPKDFDLPNYSTQWHLHRSEEKMAEVVSRFATLVDRDPLPGDIVLWKFFKAHAHACIVTEWPHAVHAYIDAGEVTMEDYSIASPMSQVFERGPDQGKPRHRMVFSFWPRKVVS